MYINEGIWSRGSSVCYVRKNVVEHIRQNGEYDRAVCGHFLVPVALEYVLTGVLLPADTSEPPMAIAFADANSGQVFKLELCPTCVHTFVVGGIGC